MRPIKSLTIVSLLLFISSVSFASKIKDDSIFIRVNQAGYLTADTKVAIAFSEASVKGNFNLYDAETGKKIFRGKIVPSEVKAWGTFSHYYSLDFSEVKTPGKYFIKVNNNRSKSFGIGREHSYKDYHEDLIGFMRQQRCGYNPFLEMVCHQRDGRTMYGPMPDSTFVDVSGGWHDAGDQLKYLITSSNATARMLKAYELAPDKFGDKVNELGQEQPNGIPDVLDEAKWGLDWIHKMHAGPDMLFHQVADDRDHLGMKWPDKDSSDYGWGPNSYRVAYFANGKPQGLREHKSKATGIANLAGRSAAAMAIAARIWREELNDPVFAQKCENAALELYAMGKEQEGYQQGNSYGSPYRYNEDTWADDMEWGAAELFKNTEDQEFLEDAKRYARLANTVSWTDKEDAEHYRYYPFINVGHFALYEHVDQETKNELAGYYRTGIEHALERGAKNAFQIGVPFIWCSNNLAVALTTQIILYEKMTGDSQYHDFMLAQRDWLLGRNPWGTSMFMNIPETGEYPEDVHTSVWFLTKKEVPGGLVDGPVYASVYNSLTGLHLAEPDEFSHFQNDFVVYHDDFGDYSTNEPTMDGTAGAIFMMAYFGEPQKE
ncbi:glycoside hydrolase family 9 protein [Salinimicrobium profundisediminis]|uniref:Glycoside hydrolase family 9 protein n=1 Tax=Salinimicrobium profundisediminis TaxID=2994553 RepID=A0A9X3CXF8_9FLAO|nr:glycoside hydrolase family 9 protein [Salinimicrobium profundisediminis]MCX2838555.1 glycoside hydrolase family 9 protein [Salinimicrobium profundisediminis]